MTHYTHLNGRKKKHISVFLIMYDHEESRKEYKTATTEKEYKIQMQNLPKGRETDRHRDRRTESSSFQLFEQHSGTNTFCVSRFPFFGAKPTQDAVDISLVVVIWYEKSRKFQQQQQTHKHLL